MTPIHSSPPKKSLVSLALTPGLVVLSVALFMACGQTLSPTEADYVMKPEHLISANMLSAVQIVDCALEDGNSTKCYQLNFKSNPVSNGPYCPKTKNDTAGLGIYDGATNPGFQALSAMLWESMKKDGFDVLDASGNVKIVDPGAGGGGPPGGGPPGGGDPPGAACLEATPNSKLELTFLIPVTPVPLTSPNKIETVELVGLSSEGIPINGKPPTVAGDGGGAPGGGGAIPALDPCGGHMDPAGYYHWHFGAKEINNVLKAKGIKGISCTHIPQSSVGLVGYAKDGWPLYASQDSDGSSPTDLDECQGHTSKTIEFPKGVYHYHVSDKNAPNLPPCLKGAAAKQAFTKK